MSDSNKITDKRRLRGAESRQLILQAAVDSIATAGLGRFTLDRVAERVGVSRGLVVFHFKSKENLVEEVLNYLGGDFSAGWNAILAQQTDDITRLLRLLDYDIRFACENPNYVSVWMAFWGDAKGHKLFQTLAVPRDKGYQADLGRLLENIGTTDGYGKEDLAMIAQGLSAILFGFWAQLHIDPGTDDYSVNTRTVRLFLGKMFPNIEWPEVSTE